MDFSVLQQGTNYVSVLVFDNAGNSATLSDVFYVRKDNTNPQITDYQTGDDSWRSTNNGTYNIDFADTGGSNLSYVQTKVCSSQGQSGLIQDWTTVVSGINSATYDTNWSLSSSVWNALSQGTNYISVRVYDNAGNYSELSDVFYVRKDTQNPGITNNISGGDSVWRKTTGTTYNVDFSDAGSLVDYFQYTVYSNTGQTGSTLKSWTSVATGINNASYTYDWSVDFASLQEGANYVSVRVYDIVGNGTTLADAFYINKDTVLPSAISNLSASSGIEGEINLVWTATGDNAGSGTASSYTVKYKTSANFDGTQGDFDSATTYDTSGWSSPQIAGSGENRVLTGLTPNTLYYVAIEAIDKAGNNGAVSNLTGNSATSGADVTSPGQIANLTASTGAYPGEIDLSWTAPGDNNSTGTATLYTVRYSTSAAISTEGDWTSATTYNQNWTPLIAESTEQKTLSMPSPNTTYYFAIRAKDEVNNEGSISNSPSATSAATGPAAGVIVYGEGTYQEPRYMNWTGSGWQGEQTGPDGSASTGVINWVITRSCPVVRNEKMAGILYSDGTLSVQRWNGSIWAVEFSTTGISAANSAYRGFDIAYEQNTGRCMVVYSKGTTTNEIAYRVWDGSSWVIGETNVELGTTNIVYWVRTEPKKGSNEIMIATSDANNDIYANRWTGSAILNGKTLTTATNSLTTQGFDIAWENTSGNCMVIWKQSLVTNYDYWNGLNWLGSAGAGPNIATSAAGNGWIKISADTSSGSNKIGFASLDNNVDWNLCIWDGAIWGSLPTEDASMASVTYRGIDIAWEKDSGKCLAVGGDSASRQISYVTWTQAGGWSSANLSTAPKDSYLWGGTLRWLQLTPDPNTNKMTLVGIDANADIRSRNWTGSTWSGGTQHEPGASNSTKECEFIVFDRHDITPPTIADNQTGDDTWRISNNGTYDIDFTDSGGSKLSYIQTKVFSNTGQTGSTLQDWTTAVSSINADSYTTNWSLAASTWTALQEGTNYVSVKIFDGVGNSDNLTDVFYVKKDSVSPGITDNQTGDDTWKTSAGTNYNIDFSDGISLLNNVQYAVYSNTVLTGSTLKDWTNIASSINSDSYTQDWAVDFASCNEGTNYVSIRAYDNAGNWSTLLDSFYVRKDTTNPGVTDNQTGDDTWKTSAGTTYNVDFTDTGGSLLSYTQYTVWTDSNQAGTQLKDWTNIATSINASDYTDNWQVDWASLQQGTNYVSVRAFDNAGNSVALADVFYVKKDTTSPAITDNQLGDDTWKTGTGTTYNIDFSDNESQLSYTQYTVYSNTGQTGTTLKDWINIASSINASSYTNDWQVDWASLQQGTNYVSVRVYDNAGLSATLNDVFYVKKDTNNPVITDTQTGDDTWKNSSGTTYNIDFSDSAGANNSLLSYAQYTVYSDTGQTGSTLKDWTNIASGINALEYTDNWQIDFASGQQGTNYVSVRVYDNAGLSATLNDVFYVKKDTNNPGVTDNQTGDDIWRTAAGISYNVDFSDTGGSLLSYAQYTIYANTNQTSTQLKPWTNIASSINASDWTDNWQVDFASLQEGTNYVSARVYDNSGNWATLTDVFYIKKSATAPTIGDNQNGDDTWRASSGTSYDVDWTDAGSSLLSYAQWTVYSNTGQTGSTLKDWTNIASSINAAQYTDNWQVDWVSLSEGTNYVSVRVYNNAGASTSLIDAFYVKKDVSNPTITDSQTGDDTWKNASGTTYNIDFVDTGNSLLSYAQYAVYSNTGLTGSTLKTWTAIVAGINASDYTNNWQVDWASLQEGTNYVSVKVFDNSGNSASLLDMFYVKKDTNLPTITNNQAGTDNTWRTSSGTTYNVDFYDTAGSTNSLLSYIQYAVYSNTGQTGSTLIDWTNIASSINASDYTTNWSVNFSLLTQGTNYVSVRVYDNSGNSANLTDAFYIKKDITSPGIADDQTGDDTWKSTSGTSYNIDWTDTGNSQLSYAQYTVYSNTALTGSTLIDWTNIATSINSNSYTNDWQVNWTSLQQGTNYVSVRVYDNAGLSSNETDAFYIKKDTSVPGVTDNQSGDDIWKKVSGTAYDVDFTDTGGSLLSYAQYTVYSNTGQTGSTLKVWTNIATGINANSYTIDWQVDFSSLQEGTNYVSVKTYDVAGNSVTLIDPFYVKKDTLGPVATNNISGGDNTWRTASGTTYDVDFTDTKSLLSYVQYTVYSGTGLTGSTLKDWTNIATSINAFDYTDNWQVDFTSLQEGTNYVTVRAYDNLSNLTTLTDAFYVKKDTTNPGITDNQTGDDTWKKVSGTTYNADFSDNQSLLSYAQYTIWSNTVQTGSLIKDWTNIATSINAASYTIDWQVDFNALQQGTNYVSVRCYDNVSKVLTQNDIFYVKKDTNNPTIEDLQSGDDTVRSSGGTTYNVNFSDTFASSNSLLSYVQYTVYNDTGLTGESIIPWTNIASSINASDYTTDWEVNFGALQQGTNNYVSVRVYDNAGNSATLMDPFYVKKAIGQPTITDNQLGDDVWRNTNAGIYNIDFTSGSGENLSYFQTKVTSLPNQSGSTLQDWTTVVSSINATNYTNNWAILASTWSAAQEGTNYVSVRIYDIAANTTTTNDVFYVRKDTTNPGITDSQAGDDTWKNSTGTAYNVDFSDAGSLLSYVQYTIYSNTNLTGSTLKDWTNIATSINVSDYTTDWQVDFSSLQQGTNYVSVRVYDTAGNSATLKDPFYVKKDTTNPGFTDNQTGDDTWRTASGTSYDVDFTDTGGANLSYAQYTIYSNTNLTGNTLKTWTNIATGINAASYTDDWQVDWASLQQGTNYVSVRTYDNAGNSATLVDPFYIKKDTVNPGITDNQTGDDNWKTASGTSYNIDFSDAGSLVSYFQYTVYSNTGFTGSTLKDWTTVASSINNSNYTTNWQVDFASLQQGTNYVSVRVFDNVGNSETLADAFYVKKDTSASTITDNQTGDDTWKNASGTSYNIDFSDANSLLSYAQYTIYSNTNLTGTTLKTWTDIATSINATDYTDNWQINFNSCQQGTNYVSVRVYDNAGNSATLVDPFYIKKDTTNPQIGNNQTGDNTWKNISGTTYNVDFSDTGGANLSYVQYTVYSNTLMTGSTLKDWTNIATSINASDYTDNWQVDWASLNEGTNYVSVRAYDNAGNSDTLLDAFYVRKDVTNPGITDSQAGDDTFRNSSGTIYNVDFSDTGNSNLSYVQYTVYSNTGLTGSTLKTWTNIAITINAADYTNNWQVDWASLQEGTNYVSVCVYDNAGNSATLVDPFYVRKDVTNPGTTDSQTGDDTWRSVLGTSYNIDFSDTGNSQLSYAQYTVYSGAGMTGSTLKTWTNIATSINANDYTNNWQVDFASLQEGTNYVSSRVYDNAGNSVTLQDAFYVKKDTQGPGITDNQTGDDTFRKTSGTTYNVDFSDTGSLLSYFQYTIYSDTGQTGTTLKDWTTLASSINNSDYTTNWQVDWASLQQGTSYVSVRVSDNLNNSSTLLDVFYVKKDTNNPTIPDNQTGDDTWKNASGTTYNVDFSDTAGSVNSLLSYAQYTVYSNPGLAGSTLKDWTNIASSINALDYTDNWQVDFASIQQGINYVSVRTYDNANNSNQSNDVFYVKKDTQGPIVTDNQTGDDTWKNTGGTTYNIDFSDANSLLSVAQYAIYSNTNLTGSTLKDWTNIASSINAADYTDNWQVDWTALQTGTNYVSVRVSDNLNNSTTLLDPFYVKKDTTNPGITDNQTGDDNWKNSSGTAYNIDFTDTGNSNLSYAQYTVWTDTGQTGTQLKTWTNIASSINATDYTDNWQIDFSVLQETTNYVSVKVFDNAGNSATLVDPFYVKKDVTNPGITDNQTGDDTWRNASGTSYNIDWTDTGNSLLNYVQYTVYSGAGMTGSTLKSWTNIATSINANSYTDNWQVDWASLQEGTNYVTSRGFDNAGNSITLQDSFYVKKDTVGPGITDNQTGDDTWKNASGTTYNIDFSDTGSQLSYFQYTIYSGVGLTGSTLKDWTTVASSINNPNYTTDWQVDFASCQTGTNYVSVRCYDNQSNVTTLIDPFYVKKDTTNPSAIANLAVSTGTEGVLNLTWTASGDDAGSGTVSNYLVKYKTSAQGNFDGSDVDFNAAATFNHSWTGFAGGGSGESRTITGLTASSLYYVAIKAIDKAGNYGAISNLSGNSGTTGSDVTNPGIISSLSAQTGDYAGEIKLSWTAPGDNDTTGDLQAPPNGGYYARYSASAITDTATWNAATVYSQSWTPLASGQTENRVLSGLLASTTYYFAVRGYDEVNNTSAIGNSPSATTGSPGAAAGLVLYGEGSSATIPKYMLWTGSSWGSAQSAANATSTMRWIITKSCPVVRNEKMAGVLSSSGTLTIMKYDGQANSWAAQFSVSGIGSASSIYRGFDIAYEQNTGRCVVIYSTGASSNEVAYRIWNGSSWVVGETTIDLGTTGVAYWVRLEARLGTDIMMLSTLDSNSDIYALRWTGSVWQDGKTLTTSAAVNNKQCYDIVWEYTTGNCMVLWGTGTTTNYDYFNGAAWLGSAGVGPNIVATANWLKLSADTQTSSNNIGMSSIDGLSDWNVSIWNGSSWGALPTENTGMEATAMSRCSDIAWEKDSGKCIAVGVPLSSTKFRYITWSTGSWALNPSGTANDTYDWANHIQWMQLISDPNQNKMTVIGIDESASIRSRNWTGSVWTGGTIHSSSASDYLYECAYVSFDRQDIVPPSITDNQTGDDTWRISNNGTYNIDFSDSGGSKLSYFQTRVYSGAGATGSTLQDWTTVVSGINADIYTTDWSCAASTWTALAQGTNYISAKIFDGVGNSYLLNDAFYVKKDINNPTITDNQTGDDTWKNSSGTSYNIDFLDTASLLSYVQYTVFSGAGMTGSTLKTWTNIASSINASQYTDNWQVDWISLNEGTNYVSIRAYDNAGQSSTLTDGFYVKKDTVAPAVLGNLAASPGIARGQVKLTWTAPGDNGASDNNTSGNYIVRYSTSPITNDTEFGNATDFANSWVPANAGTLETRYVTGLTSGTTYYFAIKTRDKVPNTAGISNNPNSLPQSGNVHINEIYALGATAGQDWVELYNDTGASVSLNGWTLVYNTGTISSPGGDTTVWTGGPSDSIANGARFVITPNTNLDGASGYHLKLRDAIPTQADIVQWIALSSGATNISFARISDGSKYFENDSTPTQNLSNTGTDVIKINEASYQSVSSDQFIELYNTDNINAVTVTNWILRNKNSVTGTSPYRKPFQFTRKLYQNSFTQIYFSSTDNSANVFAYTDCFGAGGLATSGDFVALENSSGQVIDRVTWQSGSNYVYYDYTATLISYENPAIADLSSPNTVGRNTDGTDTNIDNSDFISYAEPNDGIRNPQGTLATANTVTAPASPIPKKFKIELQLGENCSGGTTDNIIFIRTGGSTDSKSPHIFRLTDLGFSISSTAVQSVEFDGATLTDIDGFSLVNGAVYKMFLNTDTGNGRAAKVIKTSVTYDASVHTLTANDTAKERVGNSKKVDVLRIDVVNNSPAGLNNIQLTILNVKWTDGSGTALTTAQAQGLFGNIYVYQDNPNSGSANIYESAIDTTAIVTIANSSISLDGSGIQVITISDLTNATVNSNSTKRYFVVVELASNADVQTPNNFKASIKPDTDSTIRDAAYLVNQVPNATSLVTSSATTAITTTTTTETNLGGPTEAIIGSVAPNWDSGSGSYVGTDNSKLYALNDNGTQKWTAPFATVGAVRSTPEVHVEGSDTFIYVATDGGYLYKVRDTGTAGSTDGGGWSTNLGAVLSSSPAVYNSSIYVGCNDQKLKKINKDTGGLTWETDANVSGQLTGTVSVDEWTVGVDSAWIGSEGSSMYRINTANGQMLNSFATGNAITASPFVDAGYITASNNLFITSKDGKIYCRNSLNLSTIPAGWINRGGQQDGNYNVGSAIESSPYMSIEGANKYLYFGADDGKLYKIDATTGTLVWAFQTEGPIKSSPIVYNNWVYFGSNDGNCYCIDTTNGTIRTPGWPVLTGAAVKSMPVVSDWVDEWTKITFTSSDGKVYKLDIQ
ncbi:MAG: PQQ-binding-like beta-propeller repeat protein [Candidatus Firestonebacteria bacterium]